MKKIFLLSLFTMFAAYQQVAAKIIGIVTTEVISGGCILFTVSFYEDHDNDNPNDDTLIGRYQFVRCPYNNGEDTSYRGNNKPTSEWMTIEESIEYLGRLLGKGKEENQEQKIPLEEALRRLSDEMKEFSGEESKKELPPKKEKQER